MLGINAVAPVDDCCALNTLLLALNRRLLKEVVTEKKLLGVFRESNIPLSSAIKLSFFIKLSSLTSAAESETFSCPNDTAEEHKKAINKKILERRSMVLDFGVFVRLNIAQKVTMIL